MVELATARTGQDALLLRFEDVEFSGPFHGVWACASLIHVALAELTPVLRRLLISLKPLGVRYASFKYGISKRTKGGHAFTDMTEKRLNEVIRSTRLGEFLRCGGRMTPAPAGRLMSG